MKANELRLGNWVMFRNSETGLFENDLPIVEVQELLYIEDRTFDVEPIPLTNEWLVKFGFNKSTENVFKILHTDNNFGFSVKLYSSYAFKEKIKSVHQLQNLYFALTGEELKIN